MARTKTPKQTPMQQAVLKLRTTEPNGTGSATPEQIAAVADEFELEPHAVEGFYLEACDRAADE